MESSTLMGPCLARKSLHLMFDGPSDDSPALVITSDVTHLSMDSITPLDVPQHLVARGWSE